MTATCSDSIISGSKRLFGFTINHKHWPSTKDMANRNQAFLAVYSTHGIQLIKATIKPMLLTDHHSVLGEVLPNKWIFYGNTVKQIKDYASKLETFLDSNDMLYCIDVLLIDGQMSREEKSSYLKAFLPCNGTDTNFKILCATSGVANASIDCKDICYVFCVDLPSSIYNLAQEMGRAGRRPHSASNNYAYNLYFSLEQFVYLYQRISNTEEKCIDESYRQKQIHDLYQVMQLLANPVDCHKQLIKQALSNPNADTTAYEPCMKCSVCLKCKQIWLLVCKAGVQLVLFDVFVTHNEIDQHNCTCNAVAKAIRNYPQANKHLFASASKKKPEPMEISKLLFILIAWKIIEVKYVGKTDEKRDYVSLRLAKVNNLNTKLCLINDSYWSNIKTQQPIIDYNG